jgi:hypothetical protein
MNFADSQSVMEGKALMLKAHTKTLQAENPGWSFGRAWSRALELHPELEEIHGDEPSPSNMPADYPGPPGKAAASYRYRYDPSKPPASVPKALRKSILQDLQQNERLERVEAIEPSGKPRLVRGIDIGLISRVAE